MEIRKNLRFYNVYEPVPLNDIMFKIKYFSDHLIKNSKDLYKARSELSLDESILNYIFCLYSFAVFIFIIRFDNSIYLF